MVVIRLARHGRHKYPTYRIVAADKRRAATGKFLDILGTYNPHTKEITLKTELIEEYLGNGAQASDRVLRLLKQEKVKLPDWAKTHDRKKAPKNPEEEKGEEEKTEDTKSEEASTEKEAQPEATQESAPAEETVVAEVAQDQAQAAEEKATEVKDDKGTAKEFDDDAAEKKATKDTAEAAQQAAKE